MANIKGVDQIVKQDSWDYSKNLNNINQNLLYGDDWRQGIQKTVREK